MVFSILISEKKKKEANMVGKYIVDIFKVFWFLENIIFSFLIYSSNSSKAVFKKLGENHKYLWNLGHVGKPQ